MGLCILQSGNKANNYIAWKPCIQEAESLLPNFWCVWVSNGCSFKPMRAAHMMESQEREMWRWSNAHIMMEAQAREPWDWEERDVNQNWYHDGPQHFVNESLYISGWLIIILRSVSQYMYISISVWQSVLSLQPWNVQRSWLLRTYCLHSRPLWWNLDPSTQRSPWWPSTVSCRLRHSEWLRGVSGCGESWLVYGCWPGCH